VKSLDVVKKVLVLILKKNKFLVMGFKRTSVLCLGLENKVLLTSEQKIITTHRCWIFYIFLLIDFHAQFVDSLLQPLQLLQGLRQFLANKNVQRYVNSHIRFATYIKNTSIQTLHFTKSAAIKA